MLNTFKFLFTLVLTYLISYILCFIAFGIIWDPKGINLLGKSLTGALNIVLKGSYMSIPLAIDLFISKFNPVLATIGIGLLSFMIIGVLGVKDKTGKRVLIASVALFTALGSLKYCINA